jgi:Xaa-Pro aminopeptidase
MNIPAEEFRQRRETLLNSLGDNVFLLLSNFEHQKNSDVHFNFRQDSSFYYLTGFTEADSLLMLDPKSEDKFLLFVRPKDRTREIWDGFRYGPEGAVETFLADDAWTNEDLSKVLKDKLKGRTVQFNSKKGHPLNEELLSLIGTHAESITANSTYTKLHRLRQLKSKAELNTLRQAAKISCAAHNRIMNEAPQLKSEAELEATFIYSCMMAGAKEQAYPPIVAAGKNSTCLHYNVNDKVTKENDLVLVDAGCSWENYASDITRTFPAKGKFTDEQRSIYKAVLKTQKKCINAVKPGISMKEIQQLACKSISEELIELGLIKGSLDNALESKSYFEFFPHNIGHHIGLDVHDCDGLSMEERGRSEDYKLAVDMVVTIEPGIYIQPDNEHVGSQWRGIGIRIEDDILVTEDGYENLTIAAVKELADIEQ